MKISLKESTTVRPSDAMPRTTLELSALDKLHPVNNYVRSCYFYRSNGADNFFSPTAIQTALARALVHFYPMAGRLKLDGRDRAEAIECNGEGGLFLVAEADAAMDDVGYVNNPIPDDILCPLLDRSQGMSACPLLMVQLTRFTCGGVCLGLTMGHHLMDGVSAVHFIKSWSDIARGFDVSIPPFFDRHGVLSARDPPQPKFPHLEYQPPPKLNISRPKDAPEGPLIHKRLKLTQDQVHALKDKCKEAEENVRYSSYEVLVGHVWRCVSMAYQLPDDQETKLRMAVDGRAKLQPQLLQEFCGNVVFYACHVALAGELYSNPLKTTVRKVHEALAQMSNEYLRSAIDYLELQPDLSVPSSNIYDYECPNLGIISWSKLPFYDMDFGWGKPVHVGRAGMPPSGKTHVLPTNDGTMLYGITLPKEEMNTFVKLFYDI